MNLKVNEGLNVKPKIMADRSLSIRKKQWGLRPADKEEERFIALQANRSHRALLLKIVFVPSGSPSSRT